jgi:hypothetical protein
MSGPPDDADARDLVVDPASAPPPAPPGSPLVVYQRVTDPATGKRVLVGRAVPAAGVSPRGTMGWADPADPDSERDWFRGSDQTRGRFGRPL